MNDQDLYFKYKCFKGLKERGLSHKQEYIDRLEYEIGVILGMGFPGYFLIVQDFIKWAKKQSILVGPGRGSAAGSLVAYCLSITELDPIRWGLIFERFLNPDRISMPDIDVDFDKDHRYKVIEYVTEKYGTDRVAHIGTFGTHKSKGAIKAVARTLGYDYAVGNNLSKLLLEAISGKDQPIATSIEKVPELDEYVKANGREAEIIGWAQRIEGMVTNVGIHASGVVIANNSILSRIPLFKSKGTITTQFEMNTIEEVGLIKFDFLGIDALSKMSKCMELIKERHGIDIDIDSIDQEDELVFEKLQSGDNVGIFQLEGSAGIRDLLVRIGPKSIEDLTLLVAAYRPGPLGSDELQHYLEVRAGNAEPRFLIPELEPILGVTDGLLIYQEQIMKIATDLCGYKMSVADELRKAVGKKKKELMDKHEAIFKKGWADNGYPVKEGDLLWDQIVAFAAYGFNKTVDKDTLIATIEGAKRIEDCSAGNKVFTVQQDGNVVESNVVALHDHGEVPLWEVEFNDGTIETCTLDHKWLTEFGQQPLYAILNADLEVFGSTKVWDIQHNCQEIPMRSRVENKSSSSQRASSELQRLPENSKRNSPENTSKEQSISEDEKDCIRNSDQNFCTCGHTEAKSRTACSMEEEQSQEDERNHSTSSAKSEAIKNGNVDGTTHERVWIQTEHPSPLSRTTQAGGFYQQRTKGHTRDRWTMAFSTGSWRRNLRENTISGQNAGAGNNTQKELEISEALYGELQNIWRTYKDKLGQPISFTDRWGVPSNYIGRKIVRITYRGIRQGYDLEVDHPEHNFLLSSGLCCSNSHAAAYAFITYQTAWLKAHYPVEYMAAIMICQSGKHDDIIRCITECKRLEIEVLPPDINLSQEGFSIDEDNKIRFGLGPIKNLGYDPCKIIVSDRNKYGKFISLRNLLQRVDGGVLNVKKINSLIESGALDSFGHSRRALLTQVQHIWDYNELRKNYSKRMVTYEKRMEACQQRLVDIENGILSDKGKKLKPLKEPEKPEQPFWPQIEELDEMPDHEIQKLEHELLGFFVTSHPLDKYINLPLLRNTTPIKDIEDLKDKSKVTVGAVISSIKEITTKKDKRKMAFVTIEDLTGSIETMVFANTYEKCKDKLVPCTPLKIQGTVDVSETDKGKVSKILIHQIDVLRVADMSGTELIDIKIPLENADNAAALLDQYKGSRHTVKVTFCSKDGTQFRSRERFKIGDYKEALLRKLKELFKK